MNVLGFDIGGTKTAWAIINDAGEVGAHGTAPTESDPQVFQASLISIINAHPVNAVGMALAGTISTDHEDLVVCPNTPTLSHLQLVRHLQEGGAPLTTLENDARCALIGEVWRGTASEYSSAVMLTIGTGVGGAVMQKGRILPHPQDISLEIGRLIVDPSDVFPTSSGFGTVEALLGGRNLQERLGINLAEQVKGAAQGKAESLEIWQTISEYFHQCLQRVYAEYGCKVFIIGGKGVENLPLYLGTSSPPCPVIAARLGSQAGVYGAGRIALDIYEEEHKEWYEK